MDTDKKALVDISVDQCRFAVRATFSSIGGFIEQPRNYRFDNHGKRIFLS